MMSLASWRLRACLRGSSSAVVVSRRFRLILAVFIGLVSVAEARAQGPAIAFGDHHAIALRDNGDVLAWGTGNQCAFVRALSDATPMLVMRNAKEVAASARHTLVLTKDGKVYGWGLNPEGALGTGNTNDVCQGPVPVPSLDGKGVTHIATGY
jgi:alpha-tubulin suppressor-like RCC1 family protein